LDLVGDPETSWDFVSSQDLTFVEVEDVRGQMTDVEREIVQQQGRRIYALGDFLSDLRQQTRPLGSVVRSHWGLEGGYVLLE